MPSLGELDCQIEQADTCDPFEEYGTVYGDGVVEAYIVIPSSPQNFSIRLRSKGYISEGLAALVFMDGEYQCNRNRLNLRPPKKARPRSATEINFRMRQKEKPVGDGSFIGREWRFDNHNQIPDLPEDAHSGHFDNLGTIEILVLRCLSNDDTRSSSSSGLDMDPLSKLDSEDSGSDFGDPALGRHTHSSYAAPAVAEEDDGNSFVGGLFGGFDGPSDRPDGPNYAGDGYWVYHAYQQGPNMYNEGPHQSGCNQAHPPMGYPAQAHSATGYFARDHAATGYPPQAHFATGYPSQAHPATGYPPQPHPTTSYPPQARPPPTGPGKRVHFDMGGAPHTRAGYPHLHVPIPTSAMNGSNHGAGQQHGYPMYEHPVPFDARPPVSGPQLPGYGAGGGWGGQGYTPYPMHPGYGPGYGAGSGFGYYQPGFYQGQGHGPGNGPGQGVVNGPPHNQNGNMNNNNTGDPAKEGDNQNDGWGDNNDGASGSKDYADNASGGGDDWSNGGNDNFADKAWENNDNSGGANNDTSNNVNGGGNDDGWGNEDNKNDNNGDTNNDSSNKIQMGDTFTRSNSQQNNDSWANNDSGNNQQDNSWADNNNASNQNQNQGQVQEGNDWGLQNNINNNNTNFDTFQPQLPGSFPSSTPPSPAPSTAPTDPTTSRSRPPSPPPSPTVEEEPRYDVPLSHIAATSSTHQVVPGQGYIYSHRLATPLYIDSVSRPYARFVFKYRTVGQLASEIGVSVDGTNPSEEEVAQLAGLSKEEVIGMLLRAKAALGGKLPGDMGEGDVSQERKVEVKPVVVPAPVRMLKQYSIPVRAASRGSGCFGEKLAGLGLSMLGSGALQPQRQQDGWLAGGTGKNAPQNANASGNLGWGNNSNENQQQPQNRNSTWDSSYKGNAGARPETPLGSPVAQNQTLSRGQQTWGGTNEAAAPDGGASGW